LFFAALPSFKTHAALLPPSPLRWAGHFRLPIQLDAQVWLPTAASYRAHRLVAHLLQGVAEAADELTGPSQVGGREAKRQSVGYAVSAKAWVPAASLQI